jgi:hypothetical protein
MPALPDPLAYGTFDITVTMFEGRIFLSRKDKVEFPNYRLGSALSGVHWHGLLRTR